MAACTAGFHLGNIVGRRGLEGKIAPKKYRIRLIDAERDLWLRSGTGDLFVLHETFTSGSYRIPDSLLSGAATIVDLGANIGIVTLFLAQSFPAATYVCVEPNPLNAEVLRRNVSWFADRVTIVESAVADYCGEISFSDSGWSWGGHIGPESSGDRTVPCTTVGALLESQRIDFVDLLKVDIEGAEELIFANRPEWLARVGCIMVELHGVYSFERFARDLEPLGFRVLPAGSETGNPITMAISTRWAASHETASVLDAKYV